MAAGSSWGLSVPKTVIIPNPKLTCLYYILWFIVFAFLLARFIVSQQWLKKFDITHDMFAHTWVAGGESTQELQAGWGNLSASESCTSPIIDDYWLDSRESSKFMNYTCKQPCANDFFYDANCVPSWDLYKVMRDYVFLVTSFRSTEHTKTGTFYDNYLVSSADNMVIGLSYGFDVSTPGGFLYVLGLAKDRGSRKDVQKARSKTAGVGGHLIKTVIVNSDGSLRAGDPQDGSILMSVKTLLELAGKPDLLDGIRPDVGPNAMPGSNGSGPTTRRVGVDIIISIECGDTKKSFWPASWSSEYTCHLSVRTGDTPLVEYEYIDNAGYEQGRPLRARKMYGIRVMVQTRGYFMVFDSNNVVLQLIAFLVLLAIPKKFVVGFMTTFLGRLSLIYSRLVYEEFPVRAIVAGMVTSLISSGNAFNKLVEAEEKYKNDDDDDAVLTSISDLQMKERLHEIFGTRHPNHSEEEIKQMVDFCFYMVFKSQKDNARQPGSTTIGKITFDGFVGAIARNDKMTLDDLLALFDWSKKQNPLEFFFTPGELRQNVLQKQLDESGLKTVSEVPPVGSEGSTDVAAEDADAAGEGHGNDHHDHHKHDHHHHKQDSRYAHLPPEIVPFHKRMDKQLKGAEDDTTDLHTQLLMLKEQMHHWKKHMAGGADSTGSVVGEGSNAASSREAALPDDLNRSPEAVDEETAAFKASKEETTEAIDRLRKDLQAIQAQHAVKYHRFMERLESLEHAAEELNSAVAPVSESKSHGTEVPSKAAQEPWI